MTSKSEEKSSVEKSQENQSDESELDSGDEEFRGHFLFLLI